MDTTDPIIETKAFFGRAGFWPKLPLGIDPSSWLNNFLPTELEVARALLDCFVYLSEQVTDQLLSCAFQDISSLLDVEDCKSLGDVWSSFTDAAIFTYPTGETPKPSDSGHLFVRKARRLFTLREDQIFDPSEALNILKQYPTTPVIFVDDFAGSGEQFMATWRRIPNGQATSFSHLAEDTDSTILYVVPVITNRAHTRLRLEAPAVHVRSAHMLSDRYSAVHRRSVTMPKHLRVESERVIRNASKRADIPDDMALGFADLGLSLAFSHSVPDATLPLYWHESPNWKALVKRQ